MANLVIQLCEAHKDGSLCIEFAIGSEVSHLSGDALQELSYTLCDTLRDKVCDQEV